MRGTRDFYVGQKFYENKKYIAGILLIAVLFLSACGGGDTAYEKQKANKVEKEIFAMDTIMKLTIYGQNAEKAFIEAENLITQYDSIFSVTNPKSDVSKINNAKGSIVSVSEATYDLVQQSLKISEQTGGLFDISIYPLVKLWGFTTEHHKVPDENGIQLAMKNVNYKKIELLPENQIRIGEGMEIDLGAIAKGYLSQQIIELLKKQGISSAIVSLGGNVQTLGKKADGKSFVVGITDPGDGNSILGSLPVENKAVITSGIYQRYFEENGKKYHHIIDTRTGMPVDNNLASVTIISENGIMADALATALLVAGENEVKNYAKSHKDIEIIMIDKKGNVWQSDGVALTLR